LKHEYAEYLRVEDFFGFLTPPGFNSARASLKAVSLSFNFLDTRFSLVSCPTWFFVPHLKEIFFQRTKSIQRSLPFRDAAFSLCAVSPPPAQIALKLLFDGLRPVFWLPPKYNHIRMAHSLTALRPLQEPSFPPTFSGMSALLIHPDEAPVYHSSVFRSSWFAPLNLPVP